MVDIYLPPGREKNALVFLVSVGEDIVEIFIIPSVGNFVVK